MSNAEDLVENAIAAFDSIAWRSDVGRYAQDYAIEMRDHLKTQLKHVRDDKRRTKPERTYADSYPAGGCPCCEETP